VDLSTAPGPGAVQLELWHGLNILVSAPLLLLPPLRSPSSTDPLLEELHQHVAQAAWGNEAEDSSFAGAATGVAAFLTDLGQLVHTVACISSSSSSSGSGASAHATAEGPAAWGGVAASTARRGASDSALLHSTSILAEGLLEFLYVLDLTQTAELVLTARDVVNGRVEALRAVNVKPSACCQQLQAVSCVRRRSSHAASEPGHQQHPVSFTALRHQSVCQQAASLPLEQPGIKPCVRPLVCGPGLDLIMGHHCAGAVISFP
jgi:hypothetical protein